MALGSVGMGRWLSTKRSSSAGAGWLELQMRRARYSAGRDSRAVWTDALQGVFEGGFRDKNSCSALGGRCDVGKRCPARLSAPCAT